MHCPGPASGVRGTSRPGAALRPDRAFTEARAIAGDAVGMKHGGLLVERHASIDNQARPITAPTPLETTVVTGEAGLSGLIMRFGTFKRENRSTVKVFLTRVRTGQTKSGVLATASLVDNSFVTFRFSAFENAAGETFTISLRSSAGPESCVAAFVTPHGHLEARLLYGEFMLDDTSVLLPSDLIVQTVDTRASQAGANGLAYTVTRWWVDRFGIYVEGSLALAETASVARVRLSSAETIGDLSFEALDQPRAYGFSGYVACRPGQSISLLVDTDLCTVSTRLVLPYEPLRRPPSPDLFLKFIDLVNGEKNSVLEVGSRKSSPFSVSNRQHFQPHVRFVGFDILPGENTDVVGDAHHLTRYFPVRSLGAAYSLTVLEHLLMPWRFAVELNRVLELGGLIYHATHQSWPLHAEPNDFYRYSDEALKFLFGAEAGFEVVASHMEHRLWLYPEDRTARAYLLTPLFPGYGNSQVLARKVRHIESIPSGWDVGPERLTERSRMYPLCQGE
jgi:hypothetical protein